MIGALLNYVQRGYKASLDINPGNQFSGNIFGYGVQNYTVTTGTFITNKDLAAKNGNSLEFHDLTIEKNAVLSPERYNNNNGVAIQGDWNTLFLKCSGTLTVNGLITSANTGTRSEYFDDRQLYSANISPIPITFGNFWGNYGFSTPATTLFRFQNYGINNSLFTNKLFLIGGSAGGCHSYRHGGHRKRHYNHSRNWGITYGGGKAEDHGGWGGNGGGFLALYYEKLIIDGKEYGKDSSCDITRVSANGLGYSSMSGENGASYSGGCMVKAAKTIIINGGSINSNGGYDSSELNNPITMCENYNKRRYQQIYKFSLLNNLPQLNIGSNGGPSQEGYLWDNLNKTYKYGYNNTYAYYYDDGTGHGVCNQAVGGVANSISGGAGIALGFKVK